MAVQHIRRAALVVAPKAGTGPLGRAEARAEVVVHVASVLRLVAAGAHAFVAEEAVFDGVGGAHVCGAAGGVDEMRGAFDTGESVGVRLAITACCNGAVCSCASRRELRRESESEAGHDCEGIFGKYLRRW